MVAHALDSAEQGKYVFPVPFAPENLVSRDRFGRPVPRQPAHYPHESDVYSRDSSRFARRRPHIPPTAIGSVPSLSGHAFSAESPRARGQ